MYAISLYAIAACHVKGFWLEIHYEPERPGRKAQQASYRGARTSCTSTVLVMPGDTLASISSPHRNAGTNSQKFTLSKVEGHGHCIATFLCTQDILLFGFLIVLFRARLTRHPHLDTRYPLKVVIVGDQMHQFVSPHHGQDDRIVGQHAVLVAELLAVVYFPVGYAQDVDTGLGNIAGDSPIPLQPFDGVRVRLR